MILRNISIYLRKYFFIFYFFFYVIIYLIRGRVYYPSSKQVANGDIEFASLANMKGNVNCTTPFKNITWLRGDFDFMTTG